MSIHDFSVIMVHSKGKEMYYTGAFKKQRFAAIRKILRLPIIIPALSEDKYDAEFHLSPKETIDTIIKLRVTCPSYQWYYGVENIPERRNIAMTPHFCVVVWHDDDHQMKYYVDGASSNELTVTEHFDNIKWMNIDQIRITCESLTVNHKRVHYMAIPHPDHNVPSAELKRYIGNNPPRSMFMTFKLRR